MTKAENIANELYDLITVCALPNKQADHYAELKRKHAGLSKAFFKKFLTDKNVTVGSNNILIGKHCKITIENI